MPLILPDVSVVPVEIDKNGVLVGTEPNINFISGVNVNTTVTDNAAQNRVDVTVAGTTTSYVQAVLASSPSSLWLLDETSGTVAADANSVVNGTYVGTPTLAQPALIGTGGTSVYLGDGDGVNMGTAAYPLYSGAWTLECWINVDTKITANQWQMIATRAYTGGSGNVGWFFYIKFDATSQYRVGVNRYLNAVEIAAETAVAYNMGDRHHVVATYDGTNSKVVVDGVLAATGATDTRILTAGSANFMLGNIGGLSTAYALYGYQDVFSVYTRALPVSELNTHYQAGL